jgi:hypothetical protein
MPGVTRAQANAELVQYDAILGVALGPSGPRATGEPALACYASGSCRAHRRRG